MATRVTQGKLPAKIIATDTTVAHPLGLTDSGIFPSGGQAVIKILSGNIFFSVNGNGVLDKSAAASATTGDQVIMTFGPEIGDINYQATVAGDSFNVFI